MSNCITIYTDASFCPRTKVAGWAAWVKCDNNQAFTYSGILKRATCCTVAEMMAIANAIWMVIRKHYQKGKMLVVVTDSKTCKRCIENKKSINPSIQAAIDYLLNILPEDCQLKVNKVKAHSANDGKRSYVNSLVDGLAKAQMRQARAYLEREEICQSI